MKLFKFSDNVILDVTSLPDDFDKNEECFILCRTHEILGLHNTFGFDESTVIDCTDLDESIRYTNYEGYDFISLVHVEPLENELILKEINLYVSAKYLVLVMPEHDSPRLFTMEKKLLDSIRQSEKNTAQIDGIYYMILHNLLVDFSDMLEAMEDRIQILSDGIVANANKRQFAQINLLRNMAYAVKKQLRALSYIGGQILLDENNLISKGKVHYFRNIDTRLKRLYDFSENLYNLGSEILNTYDSRLTMKTNDTVNKLTALTLFFGPLTVITGIYGMNFDFMPELHWPLGYPLVIVAMISISAILFYVMRRKKWL